MINFFLKEGISRSLSFTLLLALGTEIIFPTAAMALTSGPSQPEVQSFTPVSSSDMVDISSGDFKYNIPLMDIEGYPLNLAYAAGINTDQEASWVGLGWNLNVGAINRAMRGLPDDFKGEKIKKELNTKPNRTFAINGGVDFEIFGKPSKNKPEEKKGKKFKFSPSVGVALNYNNYTGFGLAYSVGMGISSGDASKNSLNANLGLSASAASGLDISPNISYSAKILKCESAEGSLSKMNSASGSLGSTFNTRAGLKQLTFGGSFSKAEGIATKNPDGTQGAILTGCGSGSGSGCINFGLQSYSPSSNWSMVNNSVLLNFKMGMQLFGSDANLSLGGSYSSQKLMENSKEVEAYGYMYSDFANGNDNAMLDFNREKDGSYSRTTKNLPLTNFTYDVFNITGHGVGGAFRSFRSDVGHVYDASTTSQSDSYSLGGELSGGNLFKAGGNISVTDVASTSGKWVKGNKALDYFQFKSANTGSDYEPFYFKRVGEFSYNPSNMALYNSLQGDVPYGIRIQQGLSNTAGSGNSNLPNINSQLNLEQFNYDNPGVNLTVNTNALNQRQKRNQFVNTLTLSEAKTAGLQKALYTTGVNRVCSPNIPMQAYANMPDHHIAEMSVVNADGTRYYYGLPAYNIKNVECSFNISGAAVDQYGLVNYNNKDASLQNERGIDNYYSRTETPAYAYSYLLTAVVSADYSDINGNGPDDQDIGTYTKFHYQKSTSGNNNYQWRMPVSIAPRMANFGENAKSNNQDDMANYTYGEKEIWFIDEIETRNYIAKFELSDRMDALGVADEIGNLGGPKNKRLDKIVLYAKKEYLSCTANQTTPIPIKTVYFDYDYSLCTGIPNVTNMGGKLTLKRVFFTYGKSNRAAFNAYTFTYSAFNPNYHPKAFDRWGNHKPCNSVNYLYSATPTNAEMPYVEQNKSTADQYTSAWSLTKIGLPTGGELTINYESDDYAFVQNMPAGEMFKVIGTCPVQPTSFHLGSPAVKALYQGASSNNFLIVDINNTYINNDADFVKYYLKDINETNKQLFFKFLVNLTSTNASQNPNYYEYVSGYADVKTVNGKGVGGIIKVGGVPSGKAWIELKEVSLKNKGNGPFINPIAMSAIQFARINHGNVVWGANFAPPDDIEEALKQLAKAAAGSLKTMVTGFKNPNKAFADKNYCSEFVPEKSVVRLYTPYGKRLGGGSRVSSIALNDKWNDMTNASTAGQPSNTYEQAYTYETTDEGGRLISSGVASYEPMIGSEENMLKQPFYLGKNKWALLAPDDRYYVEGPFGESFYPAPNICYSKVKVNTRLPANAANASVSAKNGYKVYEFYTAKDYPTITRHTPIMPKQFRTPLPGLLKIVQTDLVYASQGYVIITNDMHGKAKAELDFSEGKSEDDPPEKSVSYSYKTKGGYQKPVQKDLYSDASYSANELDNECSVIDKDAVVSKTTIGVDFDAIADFREAETETKMVGTQVNVATFMVGVVPILVPSVFPSFEYELTRFRSAVLTKVVNRYGILEKTDVTINASTVSSENVAYDAETGDVLVTRTTNNFNDPVYDVKFPAHWGYDLMGSAYKTTGLNLITPASLNGKRYVINGTAMLNLGDEVLVSLNGISTEKGWVTSKNSNNEIGISDANGNPCSSCSNSADGTIKVTRSARRNLMNAQMSSVTCLKNPIVHNAGLNRDELKISAASQVLNAAGVKYADNWHIPLGLNNVGGCTCSATNLDFPLRSFLNSMFNYNSSGNNAPVGSIHSFFNGSYSGVQSTAIQANSTLLWKDPAMTIPSCPGAGAICSFPAGFYPPGYSINHAFRPELFNELPQDFCNGSRQYVVWNGPAQSSGVAGMFNGNKITGYFATCGGVYTLSIDFSAPGFTGLQKNEFYNHCQYLRNGTNQNVNGNHVMFNPATNQDDCNGNELACILTLYNTSTPNTSHGTINYPVKISASFLNGKLINNCQSPNGPLSYVCGNLQGFRVNPYTSGIKGNWRSQTNYSYLTNRVQNSSGPASSPNTDIRQDGYYANFSPLYTSNTTSSDWLFTTGSGADKWVNTVETTKYNQQGLEIETKDALGRYSAAIYGYNEALPVAVASNARLREIGYDGFEDYNYFNTNCNREPHFAFRQATLLSAASISPAQAHSGKYSLQVAPNITAVMAKAVSPSHQQANTNTNYFNYQLADADFIYPFNPVSNANTALNYFVSYWVKEISSTPKLTYSNAQLWLSDGSSAFAISNLKKSALIDGWQRVEFNVTIPAGYSGKLNVNANGGGYVAYFDDVRIHPADAKMKSYVYHPLNMKYMAELDENNYATFYEYDDQGNLVRIKKETEKGIMTIKESKTHYLTP